MLGCNWEELSRVRHDILVTATVEPDLSVCGASHRCALRDTAAFAAARRFRPHATLVRAAVALLAPTVHLCNLKRCTLFPRACVAALFIFHQLVAGRNVLGAPGYQRCQGHATKPTRASPG